MEDVLALLDKLENYIAECSRLPLVGKIVVDEEEIYAIIDDLRASLPHELEQARWLLKERDRVLAEARKEADEILKDAESQISTLASESVISKEAQAQAEEIMERAKQVAREISEGAKEYADSLMASAEEALAEALETIRSGRRELNVRDSSQVSLAQAEAAASRSPGAVDDEEDEEDDEKEDQGERRISLPRFRRKGRD